MEQNSDKRKEKEIFDESAIASSSSNDKGKGKQIDETNGGSSFTNKSGVILHMIDGQNYWSRVVDNAPYEKQTFATFKDCELYYKEYAKKCGFEARLSTTKLIKGIEGYGKRYILCNRQGTKKNAKYDTLQVPDKKKRKRPSIRVGCEACIKVEVNADKQWVIYEFKELHNHQLVNEEDIYFLNSQRRLTYIQKKLVHDTSKINIGPNSAFKLMKQSTGSFEKIGVTETDTKNFKRDWNAYIGQKDADLVIEKFNRKKQFFQDFSFEYSVGDDGTLTGLFWADEEAKRNYLAFGDVVSFDATYRYCMVFVPFTGIDNHKKCITFGAGLLSSETIDSYKWLLQAFKKTFGKEPNVMVSDQDPALLQAVPAVFTNARHRLCMWHISQKFTDKLGSKSSNADLLKELTDIVWNETINKEDFESSWKTLMDKYELNEINWFKEMFEMRDLWIPAYFKECAFSGLMRTTSRSEAENYYYGLLANTDLHLLEFISHFETAIEAQRYAKKKNDHESRYTNPCLNTGLKIEVEAAKIFTRNVFFHIQAEIVASMVTCMSTRFDESEEMEKFNIKDTDTHPRHNVDFQVTFLISDSKILCSCLRFELTGHLCRHSFYALRMLKVEKYPTGYISKRWTKDAIPQSKHAYNLSNVPTTENKEEVLSIIREVYFSVDFIIDKLVNKFDKLKLFRDEMKDNMRSVEKETKYEKPMNNKEVIETLTGVLPKENVDILPPKQVNNKGSRRTKKRMKGKKEIAKEKVKKDGRTCHKCGRFIKFGSGEKHDARNCHKFQGESSNI